MVQEPFSLFNSWYGLYKIQQIPQQYQYSTTQWELFNPPLVQYPRPWPHSWLGPIPLNQMHVQIQIQE